MLYGLALRDAVCGGELLVGDVGGIVAEGIDLWYVALYEDFQGAEVDESSGVRDYGIQEASVLLVAPQLSLAVVASGYYHRIEPEGIAQYIHIGVEPQLPAAVLHIPGHDYLKLQVHAPPALGNVAEPRGDNRRVQPLGGHHFTVFVADCVHYQHLVAFEIHDLQGVPRFSGNLDFAQRLLRIGRQGEPGLHFHRSDLLDFLVCATGGCGKYQDAAQSYES